ncbi:hypothetical protein CASFOL_037388 [Castilleja foliolosa]|uniref:Uncharacterized protein n=1 Tax=Castilleja foliolosa TaxID=1961234 RepID=A0ABD3BMK9_9LAMI
MKAEVPRQRRLWLWSLVVAIGSRRVDDLERRLVRGESVGGEQITGGPVESSPRCICQYIMFNGNDLKGGLRRRSAMARQWAAWQGYNQWMRNGFAVEGLQRCRLKGLGDSCYGLLDFDLYHCLRPDSPR